METRVQKGYSWATQRLANYLPPWSRARTDLFSNFQQMMNPVGNIFEDIFTQLTHGARNSFVQTADIESMYIGDYFVLPRGFQFTQIGSHTQADYKLPIVTATYTNYLGGTTISNLVGLSDNTFEGLVKAAPTSLVLVDDSAVRAAVLSTTPLSSLTVATFNAIAVPTYLWITVAGALDFRTIIGDTIVPGYLRIKGTTSKGIEEEEYIQVRWNGVIKSRNRYSELLEVEAVSIEADTFFIENILDESNLYIDDVAERQVYFGLESASSKTYLQHKYYSALNIEDLQDGYTTFDIAANYELQDTAGNSLIIDNIAYDPFREEVYGTDGDWLYIWDQRPSYPDISSDLFKTPGLSHYIISEESRFPQIGEVMEVASRRLRYTKEIIAVRWLVFLPGGTKQYIDVENNSFSWTDPKQGWIYLGDYNNPLWTLKRQFTCSSLGTYFVSLETLYRDGSYERDIYPVIVQALQAKKQLRLPGGVEGSTRVSIDAEGTLWFLKSGTMYPTRLRYDVFLTDFTRKVLYFRETYSEVTVTP